MNIFKFKTKKIIMKDFCFLLAFDLFLLFSIVGVSMYSYLFYGAPQKTMAVVVIMLMAIDEIINRRLKVTRREFILLVICIFLFSICYLRNPIEIAISYLVVYFARNQDFKKIAKHACNITSVLLVTIIVSSQLGIIKDVIFEGYRHGVGFRYVLFGPSLLLNVVMLRFYLDRERINWLVLILYSGLSVWLFLKCNAILSFGLTGAIIIYAAYIKIFHKHNRKKNYCLSLCPLSFFICLTFSFVIVYLYSRNTMQWYAIDRFLSGRLQLSLSALSNYPLSLFGNIVEWVGNGVDHLGNVYSGSYYYVDNAYINLLIESGIIASLIIWSLYTIVTLKCCQMREYFLVVCFTVLSVYFVFDNLKLKLVYNTFILLLPMAFMKINREDIRRTNNKSSC